MGNTSVPAVPEPLEGTVVRAPGEDGLSELARAAVEAGTAASTLRAYAAHWEDFTGWCAEHGRVPLPATADTVTEHVTWLCYQRPLRDRGGAVIPGRHGLAPGAVRRALTAIRQAHRKAGEPVPPTDEALKAVKGYERFLAGARDPRAVPRRATAFTPETLGRAAGAGLEDLPELARLRDAALLYLDFKGATRVSELVWFDIENVHDAGDALEIALYRKKRNLHQTAVIPERNSPQAVAAVRALIEALAARGYTAGPLFPRIDKHGRIGAAAAGRPGSADGRMNGQSVNRRIRLAAKAAGLEGRYTAHSGRRGFATASRLAGNDPIAIARHMGSTPGSPTVTGYMDEADARLLSPLDGTGG